MSEFVHCKEFVSLDKAIRALKQESKAKGEDKIETYVIDSITNLDNYMREHYGYMKENYHQRKQENK